MGSAPKNHKIKAAKAATTSLNHGERLLTAINSGGLVDLWLCRM